MKKIICLFTFIVFVQSCSFFQGARNPAQIDEAYDFESYAKINIDEFPEILRLSREFLIRDDIRPLMKEIFAEKIVHKGHKFLEFDIPEKLDRSLSENEFIDLLLKSQSFRSLVAEYLAAFPTENGEDEGSLAKKENFFERFKQLAIEKDLRSYVSDFDIYRPLPLVREDGKPGYSGRKVWVGHEYYNRNGKLQKGSNLLRVVTNFISKAKSDIWVNVFDFDLEEVADALIKKAKEGIDVNVGIDAGVISQRPEVKAVFDKLESHGVKVTAVNATGLNHQKIILRDSKLTGKGAALLSSGNFTKSGIHPNGDLGDSGAKSKYSIPNANHIVTMESDLMARLGVHELTKTLKLKLRGSEYPIGGSYQVMGPTGGLTERPYFVLAFTPRGGLTGVNKNLIKQAIARNCGPEIYMMQFAFSSTSVTKAILNCIEKRKKEGLKTRLFTVGDTPFAMSDWSQFLVMSGLNQVEDPVTGVKYYEEDTASPFRKVLGEDFEEFRKQIKVAPEVYGERHIDLNGEKVKLSSKIHHKMLVLGEVAVMATSFNFSTGAETNVEQILFFRDIEMADIGRGMVKRLHELSPSSVKEESVIRNERRLAVDDEIKRLLQEIKSIVLSNGNLKELEDEISKLKGMTSKEDVETILDKILNDMRTTGSELVNFSFDWDDNIFFTPTTILVYHKETDEVLEVSTKRWAHVKNEIGIPGTEYENYEVRETSYQNFRDLISSEGIFLNDIKKALNSDTENWRGPSWESFVIACSNPESAKRTTIITARGHHPETIHEALQLLKSKGHIQYVPPVNNIWPVTNPEFSQDFKTVFNRDVTKGSVKNPSLAKTEVMKEVLDQISEQEFDVGEKEFLSPDGSGYGGYHLWGFSDDDYDNYKKAIDALQVEIDKGRWANVKITVIYTGKSHPDIQDHVVILRPNKKPRARKIEEFLEWKQALIHRAPTNDKICIQLIKSLF